MIRPAAPVGTVAIVLAAGLGSRLRPLTDDRPKCLVTVGGETLLHRALRLLAASGIERAIVSTGHFHSAVETALADAPLPISPVFNHDHATTQNVVSLARATAGLLPTEGFVKLDGDLVFADSVLRTLWRASGEARVCVDSSTAPRAEAMKLQVGSNRITRFGKALDPVRCHGESIGLEYFDASAARVVSGAVQRAVQMGRTDLYYEDVYNDVLESIAMAPVKIDPAHWTEIDDLRDLERARSRFGA